MSTFQISESSFIADQVIDLSSDNGSVREDNTQQLQSSFQNVNVDGLSRGCDGINMSFDVTDSVSASRNLVARVGPFSSHHVENEDRERMSQASEASVIVVQHRGVHTSCIHVVG